MKSKGKGIVANERSPLARMLLTMALVTGSLDVGIGRSSG
jgi:hypothetical protein